MPPRLFVLLLILKISDGFTYSDTSMCRDTTFPENLEQFLNNKNHSIISSNCKNHLLIYAEDLKLQKEWAINMLDAGAKNLSPGVLSGNLVDLGNFDACLNIEEHKNNFQITGKYCIGNTLIASNKFQTKSTLISANSLYTAPSTNGTISLYLARCFPAVCSGTEMQNVYTAIDIQLTFSTNLCQTKATQPKINTAAYIFGCITVFLICLSLYGTSLDLISLHLERERPHQMITAFSLFENGRKLLEISNSATDISCIHGIRVLSCMWLVLFHRHFLSAQLPISNFFYYRDWFKSLVNMLIHSAPLAVDTFFLLSGLFVAYNYMVNISKGMKFNIVSYYTQRYLRLTPVLVMMLLVLNVAIHVSSGPLWVNVMATDVTNCEISWWRNLLYIQNIYMDGRPVCYLHNWYLGADMQLFILSPLILNPLRKWPKQMLLLIGFLGTCSKIVSFAIGWIYQYNAVAMANEHLDEFLWNYYFPVYTRATPWLIGFVLGYFLATHKGDNVNALKRKETVYALWICAVIVLLGCVFVGHGLIANEHKRFISALHMTLVRPIWALAMSWVIFACVNGYAVVLIQSCYPKMPPRLLVLLLILKSSDGFTYSNTFTCRDTTFPEKLEQFLNNKNHSIISSNCKNHLLIYAEDLKLQKEWAINMLDAGAKNLSPGVLSGNLVDLGNFDACLNIEEHKHKITGKYCIGNALIASNKFQTKSTLISANSLYTAPSTNGTISVYLARCFPAVCSITEMQKVYTAIDFQLTFSTNLCQTKATQPKINTAAYIFGCVTIFLICLGLYATSLDFISLHLERGRPHQIITAFSLFENGRKLLEMSNSATDISCIHGIRVLSCMWLVLFHRNFLSAQLPISNFFYYRDWFKSLVNMLIHSAPLAVDTFFLLSGLFVAYNYMINISKGMKFNIVSYYTQRYLRLTPVLVIVLLVLNVAIHVSSGPLWVNVIATEVTNCEISWWRNLLYIQNIYMDGKPVCYLHNWYLSVDMQLFILSPLILNPLRKWPKQMLLLIGFLGTCSMIVSFAIGWIYQYNAVVMANEHFDEFLWNYYFPVYTRATPWLIGFVLGYFLATHKGDNVNALKRKETVYALWICAVIVLLGCVFVGHGLIANEHKRFLSALYMTLVAPIWAIAMSWVIFACANGYAGPLNLLLSLPIFQILSKLTYSLYMVHPLIINLSLLQMRAPPFLSTFDMLHKFWGDFALSLAAALLLWIGIENPMSTIYKYLTSPKKKVE